MNVTMTYFHCVASMWQYYYVVRTTVLRTCSTRNRNKAKTVSFGHRISKSISGKMPPPPQLLLLDGGVSTHLESKLSDPNNPQPSPFSHRELWSSSLLLTPAGRDAIRGAHLDFLAAGADIISTVTYQAHYTPLPGKEDDARRLQLKDAALDVMLKDGVSLAKEAIKQHKERNSGTCCVSKAARVAASIGSLGGSLADGSEYTGKFGLSIGEIESFHKRKVQVLAEEHPDFLAFETIPCIEECCAILNVLREEIPGGFSTGCFGDMPSTWLSFSCSDREHLNDGSLLTDALTKVDELDPEAKLLRAIGVNCCSLKNVKALTEVIVEHILQPGVPTRDIVLYPNSGEEWDAHNEAWLEGSGTTAPDDFAQGVVATVRNIQKRIQQQRGSAKVPSIIIGGCCRTTPETIAAIRRCIDTMQGQTE